MVQENYFISVGEPWNFESKDGQNVIRGNIFRFKNNNCLVFKCNHHLAFGDIKGDVLILTPRHSGNDFSALISGLVVVNGSLLTREYNDMLSEKELIENSKLCIMGSIRNEQSLI